MMKISHISLYLKYLVVSAYLRNHLRRSDLSKWSFCRLPLHDEAAFFSVEKVSYKRDVYQKYFRSAEVISAIAENKGNVDGLSVSAVPPAASEGITWSHFYTSNCGRCSGVGGLPATVYNTKVACLIAGICV